MQIRKSILKKILKLAQNAHPREIGGLLLGAPISDFVIMPGEFGESSISVYLHRIPIYPKLTGTFHSHPSPSAKPSGADLDFFRRFGKVHLIIAYPYDLNSIRAYDSSGKPAELMVT